MGLPYYEAESGSYNCILNGKKYQVGILTFEGEFSKINIVS